MQAGGSGADPRATEAVRSPDLPTLVQGEVFVRPTVMTDAARMHMLVLDVKEPIGLRRAGSRSLVPTGSLDGSPGLSVIRRLACGTRSRRRARL